MNSISPSNSPAQHQPSTTRRNFLEKAALLGTAAFAGCLGSAPESSTTAAVDLPRDVRHASFVRELSRESYTLQYAWSFGPDWEVTIEVPSARYESAVSADRSLAKIFDDATRSAVSRTLATALATALDDLGVADPLDRVRVVASFVRCLQYATDEDGTGSKEYPRYVSETLVENEGDCEDFAAVLAGILASPPFGADPRLVVLPGHTGVAVSPATLGLESFVDPEATADDPPHVLPTLTVGGEELLYIDPTYPVRPGVVPEPYRDHDVVASYDGGWHIHDLQALTVHLQQSVLGEGISNPLKYV